jgi:hypothetical protein
MEAIAAHPSQTTTDVSPRITLRTDRGSWSRSVINIFRCTDDGRLVEEWVQTDTYDFLRQLGPVGSRRCPVWPVWGRSHAPTLRPAHQR